MTGTPAMDFINKSIEETEEASGGLAAGRRVDRVVVPRRKQRAARPTRTPEALGARPRPENVQRRHGRRRRHGNHLGRFPLHNRKRQKSTHASPNHLYSS